MKHSKTSTQKSPSGSAGSSRTSSNRLRGIKTSQNNVHKPKDRLKKTIAAVEMIQAGKQTKDVAQELGVTVVTLNKWIQRLIDPRQLEAWKQQKVSVMEAVQQEFLRHISPGVIKGMIKRRGLVDFGILYDKTRLERGESTEIVDFRQFLELNLNELSARRQRLERLLADNGIIIHDATTEHHNTIDVESTDLGSADAVPAGRTGG